MASLFTPQQQTFFDLNEQRNQANKTIEGLRNRIALLLTDIESVKANWNLVASGMTDEQNGIVNYFLHLDPGMQVDLANWKKLNEDLT